ncbi:unnamed protein product [Ectocarpus sp. CCAP 1310/34]|nr:unnamed protein product [Ectocarpus sp. CCAP 1310/34]
MENRPINEIARNRRDLPKRPSYAHARGRGSPVCFAPCYGAQHNTICAVPL